nr:type II toxin-antitoxin system RelE/ParE family toxin [Actimicrobium sp. CCI2.3]
MWSWLHLFVGHLVVCTAALFDGLYPIDYTLTMTYTVKRLEAFSVWLNGLKDDMTRQRLIKRLRKVQLGNLGDTETAGNGVYELREHFGPGWRMYYVQRGSTIVVMLGGGSKATQQADISKAIALSNTLED